MPHPEGGFLDVPKYGVLPPHYPEIYIRKKEFEFEKIINMVREHPGQWAKIAEYKGGREFTRKSCNSAYQRVANYLKREFPLEDWQGSKRVTPDTWADRELWVTFRGTMTPEEALKLKELRRQAFSVKVARSADKKKARDERAAARARYNNELIQRNRRSMG